MQRQAGFLIQHPKSNTNSGRQRRRMSSLPDHDSDATAASRMRVSQALFLTAWVSAFIFGVYIVVFYGGALLTDTLDDWNQVLPRLYASASKPATFAIGAHFFAGAVVLLLGPLQFLPGLRAGAPSVHRMIGRVYALSALGAGIGGIAYLCLKGAIGGIAMDAGFGLYGILVVLATLSTVRYARARRFDIHREWATRLFALGIGSWLYRMDYGIWLKMVGGIGHTHAFGGPFDYIMDFFFVPNLIVAEAIIRARRKGTLFLTPGRTRDAALIVTTTVLVTATVIFTRSYWGPHIVARLTTLHSLHPF
jgi:uncharacterized membrane protein